MAVWPPLAVAVIVATPALTPLTIPPETVAIDELLEVQVTFLFVAFEGKTVALRVTLSPISIVVFSVLREILVVGTPEDIANACVYLLSDASRWVTGSNLVVDGGYTTR